MEVFLICFAICMAVKILSGQKDKKRTLDDVLKDHRTGNIFGFRREED